MRLVLFAAIIWSFAFAYSEPADAQEPASPPESGWYDLSVPAGTFGGPAGGRLIRSRSFASRAECEAAKKDPAATAFMSRDNDGRRTVISVAKVVVCVPANSAD